MTPHLNSLVETVQMRGDYICFYAELTKIIPNYHLSRGLVLSTLCSSYGLFLKMGFSTVLHFGCCKLVAPLVRKIVAKDSSPTTSHDYSKTLRKWLNLDILFSLSSQVNTIFFSVNKSHLLCGKCFLMDIIG